MDQENLKDLIDQLLELDTEDWLANFRASPAVHKAIQTAHGPESAKLKHVLGLLMTHLEDGRYPTTLHTVTRQALLPGLPSNEYAKEFLKWLVQFAITGMMFSLSTPDIPNPKEHHDGPDRN